MTESYKTGQKIQQLVLSVDRLLEDVWVPRERGTPLFGLLEKYRSALRLSLAQASGSRNIELPQFFDPEDLSEPSLSKAEEYRRCIARWTENVKRVMEAEIRKKPDVKFSLSVIEYWRDRATVLSMLLQELQRPEVRALAERVRACDDDDFKQVAEQTLSSFESAASELVKRCGEAKDNVKFLNTLERQFKALQSGDFDAIEKTIPSLLNGLKLVYIISRHFKSDERISSLLVTISNEICDTVEQKLSPQKIFACPEGTDEVEHLKNAVQSLSHGKRILLTWKTKFEKTKQRLEEEGGDRWDFDQKPIKERPEHTVRVLEKFTEVVEELRKFLMLLGPKLKAVAGNSDGIEELLLAVRSLRALFLGLRFNAFDRQHWTTFKKRLKDYSFATKEIQEKTIKLIEATFGDLRSSESAFALLQKFANLPALDHISEQLQKRYSNVLATYQKELADNKDIFEREGESKQFSKRKPPIAGAVCWKRALFQRVKTPIVAFLRHDEQWNEDELQIVKEEYKEFARQLDRYEKEHLEKWRKIASELAVRHLKSNILISCGKNEYTVNFSPEFRLLISEAKQLDKMGFALPKTVLNVALQEREYLNTVDQLEKMLETQRRVLGELGEVERSLFVERLQALDEQLQPVLHSFNLNSLGVQDFIGSYKEELKKFAEIKSKTDEKQKMIEDIVRQISETRLVKDDLLLRLLRNHEQGEYFSLSKFFSSVEKDIQSEISSLAEKYGKIGDTMLPQIEFVVFKSNTACHPRMKLYYLYWERRVYNALVSMLLRALLTLKSLIARPGDHPLPLFKVSTEFHYLKVVTVPHQNEIRVTINKLLKNIKEAAGSFIRWKPGTCSRYDIVNDTITSEALIQYSFLRDVGENQSVKLVSVELSELQKQSFARLEKYKGAWEAQREGVPDRFAEFKQVAWNQKNKFKIDKLLEKNSSLANFEFFLDYFQAHAKEFESQPAEVDAGFIRVDFTNVKAAYVEQCVDSLTRIGASFLRLAERETEEIYKMIFEYNAEIDQEADSLTELKEYLSALARIKDESMDVEFRIAGAEEKFRVLLKYELKVNEEQYDKMKGLGDLWRKLLNRVALMDESLKEKKETFASQTELQVEELKADIAAFHQAYFNEAQSDSLAKGLTRLEKCRKKLEIFNERKNELVLSEKLFSLEVSQFPLLAELERDVNLISPLFEFYADMESQIDTWSKLPWNQLEYSILETGKKKFTLGLRKMKDAPIQLLDALKARIEQFSRLLPQIEKIKATPSFQESHWLKLVQQIGQDPAHFNAKTLSLQQVFALNLQDFNEDVDEVVTMAAQQSSNAATLRSIEKFWREADFEISSQAKGVVVKIEEAIFLSLNDHLVTLQNMDGTKHAQFLRGEIRTWVSKLNQLQETLELWVEVQRKWLYLEGIFLGNEDISQQLDKEAKNFQGYHKTFSKLNEQAARQRNLFANCVTAESTLPQLRGLSVNFDRSQKSLSNYLLSKKMCFPRFYFISDDDLLAILGQSDVASVEPHLPKLFDNCAALMRDGKIIQGMISHEGETLVFKKTVKAEGAVEVWMSNVDTEMKETVRVRSKEGVYRYGKMERVKWIENEPGMVVLAGSKVWWTWRVEDTFRKVKEGDKYAMKAELAKQSDQLLELIALVRSDLEAKDPKGRLRKKINTLIIIEVHQRDIVDSFVRDSILDAGEFEWESQLRFYWSQSSSRVAIKQCTGEFSYGCEYQGLAGRLVITPLTDRCVMTLTTALSFCLGGAPAGPAGTGKTETCKDLAKALACRCVVTNCGENFDSEAMGTVFSGLCQTGFWGCFDEFNRINPAVLSVVSTQIKAIQHALLQQKKTVNLMNADIVLRPTLGIFVTMNPGYEGRSELPDNLKALFRPVVMVVPDKNIICENMLMSEGFASARSLAKKMTVLYKLAEEQLSRQHHYDFGLRALKSVLVMAGALKRASPSVSEARVLMRALRDMNLPKFVSDDVSLFAGLLKDLFPGVEVESVTRQDLRSQAIAYFTSKGLQIVEEQISKVIQLHETMQTRHTTMVVGPTCGGKSSIIQGLKEARQRDGETKIVVYDMNPKAQSSAELYGEMDPQTRDWTDGILSRIFRLANQQIQSKPGGFTQDEERWILFDGDVDAVWVENMNSVMDDNKILTLSNGDRIRLQSHCKLLFEVFDLQYASPATISRCGMVFVDRNTLHHTHYFRSWAAAFKETILETEESLQDCLLSQYDKIIPPLVELMFEGKTQEGNLTTPFSFLVERCALALTKQLTQFIQFSLNETSNIDSTKIEYLFVFATVWSFGAGITTDQRNRFSKAVKDLCTVVPPGESLYDGYYDLKEGSYLLWDNLLAPVSSSRDGSFSKILVPTTDTIKYTFLLDRFLKGGAPLLLVGEQGTAKTVILKNYLDGLDKEKNTVMSLNFSFRTSSMEVQKGVELQCDKRRPGLYTPKGGKKLLVFIDEMHMPKKDKYGTQEPIALLRFLIERGVMFERTGSLERRRYEGLNFCAALLPPGAGCNSLDPRFLNLFVVLGISAPSENNIEKIYSAIFSMTVNHLPKQVKSLQDKIIEATIKLYERIQLALPRTPLKFHYLFNLRDLSRLFQGLGLANKTNFSTELSFLRLWRSQATRVFCDRLVSETDVEVAKNLIKEVSIETFGEARSKEILMEPLLLVNFMKSEPLDEEKEDLKLFEEVSNENKLRIKLEDLLEQYNGENIGSEMNLVLFADAMGHLARVSRVLTFPKGHALLVGFGGSGKKSLSKLACFIAGYELFQIQLKRGYGEVQFREDLEMLYTDYLAAEKEVLFLFTEQQVVEEGFLELINTMLTTGVISSLFDDAKKNDIRNTLRLSARKAGYGDSPEEIWEFFEDMVNKNLHLILCMSPAGENLRVRCRNFPGLVSSTAIDWFFAWPEEALRSVASSFLEENDFDVAEKTRKALVDHFVFVHLDLPSRSAEYLRLAGRYNHSTPKNYLDFLENFKTLFENVRKSSQENVARFVRGLDKLEETAQKISTLQIEIDKEKKEVEREKSQVEILLAEISEKSAIVAEKQKIAQEKSASLEVENIEIIKGKEEADRILAEKLPALEEARVKVSEIQKGELDYIRSFNNPPRLIQMTVNCLQILRVNSNANESDGWSGAKAMLSDLGLITALVDFSKDKKKIKKVKASQIKAVNEKLRQINKELDESNKEMDDISPACTKLLLWVNAVKLLYETNEIIKPLELRVEALTRKKVIKEAELIETNQNLSSLTKDLTQLNDKKDKKETALKILHEQVERAKTKLEKAEALVRDLTSERVRWSKEKQRLGAAQQFLHGHTLLAASFLSYFGPFDQSFRRLMSQCYQEDIKERGLSLEEGFRVENILTTEVEIALWNSQGLPNDELSVQNGILTARASRYPLCIDPQQQALVWVLKRSGKTLTRVSSGEEGDLGRSLEMSVKFGTPLLVENVGEILDPLLDPLLERNFVVRAGRKYLRIGTEEIEFNDKEFQMTLVTKIANPRFSPEVMGKTSVVNYSVTFEGLSEQLLSEVVSYEEEEKEQLRRKLIKEMSENKQTRERLEDELLTNLVNAKGSLLDNDELVKTLEETKTKSTSIEESIVRGAETRRGLEQARQAYRAVAVRGSVLFFCMQKLSAVSEMYEYSLSSYLEVFRNALHEAKKENLLEHRILSIVDKLTQSMYDYVLLGMFETHKLMFSFQMTIMILEQEGELERDELDFFLKGNTTLNASNDTFNISWLDHAQIQDLIFLCELSHKWKQLKNSLENNELEWKRWYDFTQPEIKTPPMPFHELNSWEVLLLLRIFRPDRVLSGVRSFVIAQYRDNEHYVTSPTINFKKILHQSSSRAPVLFILSPGADPLHDVLELASNEGFAGSKFKCISLGQNMDQEAEELIVNFAQRGYWAMLQNCDLLPQWLPALEQLLERLPKTVKVHRDFRLWLTTKPTLEFPLGILQNALKVVIEPPESLRLNMRAIASKFTEGDLNSAEHPRFRPLVYVIIYFHAILLDRRKFGKIGFNVSYDFNESDFRISFQLLRLYLNKAVRSAAEVLPWESLKYLIGEAMYGGRVTDEFDRRVLITYLDEFMGDFLFDDNSEFAFARAGEQTYTLPNYDSLESLTNNISELPLADPPQVFGLSSNSEITYCTNGAKRLWTDMLQMQLVSQNQGSSLQDEERISSLVKELLDKTPEEFDVQKVKVQLGELTPTQVVLLQELERFNKLLIEIDSSLCNLQRALKGEIVLNSDLEQLQKSLLNGLLPVNWKRLVPATQKKLSHWIIHFQHRVNQYREWCAQGNLKVVWLAGLHVPESYLTALIQTTCRKKNWALDKSTLFTQMTEYNSREEVEKAPEFGCYVEGLFLEGARWDSNTKCLSSQAPKQLIQELPLMKINPVEVNKLKLRDSLKVPVYVTQARRNAAGYGLVFTADFKTEDHPSHWILQGIAVVLNTDQ